MVMEALQEDTGESGMQCPNHPYKNNTPGGICAFCLQEKLGNLVSSSFPTAVFPSSSSSPSPSFRSHFNGPKSTLSLRPNAAAAAASSASATIDRINVTHDPNINNGCEGNEYQSSRAFRRMPFLQTQKRKKKSKDLALSDRPGNISFNRSKSTTTPRRGGHFTAEDENTPRKRWFWSILHLSKHSSGSFSQRETKKREEFVVAVEENESPDAAAFDRKVSRSRSVGCGSRSFSGDFFERISTGFGDCTLRRVESHRESKHRVTPAHRGGGGGREYIRERVKCGGIFRGFMVTSSSSSSSSSSYLVSSSAEDNRAAAAAMRRHAHGRSKSWGWAFASPIRAFSKPSTSSSSGKREDSNKNNTTPNLNAIPSLLVARG